MILDERQSSGGAATAGDMVAPDVATVKLNRPFIFLIRDIETGTVLSIGEVMDPRDG